MLFTFYEHKPNILKEKTKNLTSYLRFLFLGIVQYFWHQSVCI